MKKTDKKPTAIAVKKPSKGTPATDGKKPAKPSKAKKAVEKNQHPLSSYKDVTGVEASNSVLQFAKTIIDTIANTDLSDKAKIDKAVNALAGTFSDAVIAVSAATVIRMPPHWKRAWLSDICEESDAEVTGKKRK